MFDWSFSNSKDSSDMLPGVVPSKSLPVSTLTLTSGLVTVMINQDDRKQFIEELDSPPELPVIEDLLPNELTGVSWSQSCHCITAETALVHVLDFKPQLLVAFMDVGFGGEYRIQVGFNQSALHEGMLVEEISIFIDKDLQVSEDIACTAFAAVFAPFPGVVYAPRQCKVQ